MARSRKKLYLFVLVACAAGYGWLYYNYAFGTAGNDTIAGVCLMKQLTDIPCFSCGSTRAVLSLLHGNVSASLYWNPAGWLILLIMVAAPVWIGFDFLFKKDSFLKFYCRAEAALGRRKVAIPFILLVLINWIWNISKGL